MKILQLLQRDFARLGLSPNQSTTQKYPFNKINVKCLLVLCGVCGSCAYGVQEATSFQEYTFLANEAFTILLIIEIYAILLWKRRLFFQFIDSLETNINKREFKL